MNIPKSEIEILSSAVRGKFLQWNDYMYSRVKFNMPDSEIHAASHCERVLLYVLILGADILGADSDALDILAHAAIFHDTRRQDDYLDIGHGARAAVYYEQFCQDNDDIEFHPEQWSLCVTMTLTTQWGKRLSESTSVRRPIGC